MLLVNPRTFARPERIRAKNDGLPDQTLCPLATGLSVVRFGARSRGLKGS